MTTLRITKPATEAQKFTETTLDTWEVSPDQIKSLKLPPFQRPLRVNDKVKELSGEIALSGGVIPGVLCVGLLGGERYLVDGQHRREAFLLSDCRTGYVDVRIVHFKTMAEMAEEFVKLNSRLVNMKPDDIIRGLESSYEAIARLRKACPFVGYDQIRRSEKTPVISMSTVLRCWMGSAHDVPHTSGTSASQLATEFSNEECGHAIEFLGCALAAWGRDQAAWRLWSSLNVTLCAWLYRRLVMSAYSTKTQRLTSEQFTRCLMSLSAAELYVDWLLGRNLCNRDLSPAYQRIKGLFATRLEQDTGRKPLLPAPHWMTNQTGRR